MKLSEKQYEKLLSDIGEIKEMRIILDNKIGALNKYYAKLLSKDMQKNDKKVTKKKNDTTSSRKKKK